MGLFNVTIQIGNLDGERFEDVDVMADTGAVTTVIPRPVLDGLGIIPTRRETFHYAGGQQAQLDLAEARARVAGRETTTWVIFGDEEMSPLLGAYTLTGTFLAVDPNNRLLIPATGKL